MLGLKKIVRVLMMATLTILPSTMLVACCYAPRAKSLVLNVKVAQHLGLLDIEGKSTQTADLFEFENEIIWTTPIRSHGTDAAKLLDSNDFAKDNESYDFITKVLAVQPNADNTFNRNHLRATQGFVTEIAPQLALINPNSGYGVGGGTFKFQLYHDFNEISPKYTFNLRSWPEKEIIASVIEPKVVNFTSTDSDVASNKIINFSLGKSPQFNAIINTNVAINNNTINGQHFNAVKKLTAQQLNITAFVVDYKLENGSTWSIGDNLIIGYKTKDMKFTFTTTWEL